MPKASNAVGWRRFAFFWWVGLALILGGVLVAFGHVSGEIVAAFLVAAFVPVPGLVLPERHIETFGLAGLSLCAISVVLTGGVVGPLAVLCFAPVVAAVWLESGLASGLAFSVASLGFTLLGAVAFPYASPEHGLRLVLAFASLLGLLVLAAAGLTGRSEAGPPLPLASENLTAALAKSEILIAHIDKHGEVLALSGAPPSGMRLNVGDQPFCLAAVEAHRGSLKAALTEALDHGMAQARFTPQGDPTGDVELWLKRASEGRVIALFSASDAKSILASGDAAGLNDQIVSLTRARAQAEEAREATDRTLRTRSKFLADMSHELRTPLNAIMGFSDIMRTRLFGDLSDKYTEYAELIHESGAHLLDLINDVLDMSKIEAERFVIHPRDFDACDVVASALRLFQLQAHEAGVRLHSLTPSHPLIVHADERAFKQILLNLISNALKFTPRGGAVTVTLESAAGGLELVVADTGIGIAQDDLARLGKPFEQAKNALTQNGGTGLGLSLVQAFAQMHGGEMSIESQLGEGTAVTVRMPVLAKPLAEQAPRAS